MTLFEIHFRLAGAFVTSEVLQARDLYHAYKLAAYVAVTAVRTVHPDCDITRVTFDVYEST